MSAEADNVTVVGLGEALFDCFPDQTVLGGAPLNVAFHAHQLLFPLGGRGTVVSRIGEDELGEQLLSELATRQLDADFVQRDPLHDTGRVNVTVDQRRQPTYEIAEDVAWDHLELTAATRQLAQTCAAVSFGTLAQRSSTSRQAIQGFLVAAPQALRVYDVNLRQDYYSAEIVKNSCQTATMVKINDEELPIVSRLLGASSVGESLDSQAEQLVDTFQLQALALTRGAEGTVLFTREGRSEGAPVSFPAEPRADSVGAGDACCAGLICGLLWGWPDDDVVRLANQLGAYVASRPGATPPFPPGLLEPIHARQGRDTSR